MFSAARYQSRLLIFRGSPLSVPVLARRRESICIPYLDGAPIPITPLIAVSVFSFPFPLPLSLSFSSAPHRVSHVSDGTRLPKALHITRHACGIVSPLLAFDACSMRAFLLFLSFLLTSLTVLCRISSIFA